MNFAPGIMPETQGSEGHAEKPASHLWHWVPVDSVPECHRLGEGSAIMATNRARAECVRLGVPFNPGPKKAVRLVNVIPGGPDGTDERHAVELLASGQQAVVPPSLRKTHVPRVYDIPVGDILNAAVGPFPQLWDAFNRLAEETLKVTGYTEPTRPTGPAFVPPVETVAERRAAIDAVLMADRADAARRYLTSVTDDDLPRSGDRGHDKTIRLTGTVVNCFACDDDSAAWDVMLEFNNRLHDFGDGWTDHDLRYKLDSAMKRRGKDARFPFGEKLLARPRHDGATVGRSGPSARPSPYPWSCRLGRLAGPAPRALGRLGLVGRCRLLRPSR